MELYRSTELPTRSALLTFLWVRVAALCLCHPGLALGQDQIKIEGDTLRAAATEEPSKTTKSSKSLTAIPAHLIAVPPTTAYYSPYVFVVDKSERSLNIWRSTETTDGKRVFERVATHPADLGKNSGDKISRGDHKTPEGVYFLLEKLEGPTLDFQQYGSRAYTTDYPNLFDKLDRKTGDGIWLHSVPDDVPLTRGSRGCVVIRNNIVTQLDPFITLGRTAIVISESIDTREPEEADRAARELEAWTTRWKAAWESKNIDSYMTFYDEDFRSMGMNRSQWRKYKENLNAKYQTIRVQLSQPMALEHRGRAIVRFVQGYTSDAVNDVGEKTLHLKKRDGEWKIISESWRADESPIARAAIGLKTEMVSVRE